MNKDVKESFQRSQHWTIGPPYGTEVGLEWHALMENCVKEVLTKTSYELYEKGDAGISLLRKLHDEMEISIISGKFPLYGYMYNNKELPLYLPSPRTNDIDRLCLFVCFFYAFSLHILDHAILRTCVPFSKKLPYLCFFSFIYELAACH